MEYREHIGDRLSRVREQLCLMQDIAGLCLEKEGKGATLSNVGAGGLFWWIQNIRKEIFEVEEEISSAWVQRDRPADNGERGHGQV